MRNDINYSSKFTILSFFFLLFSSLYFWIVHFVLNLKTVSESISITNQLYLRAFIIVLSYFIFKYIIKIVYSFHLETSYFITNKESLIKVKKRVFSDVLEQWKDVLLYSFLSLILTVMIKNYSLPIVIMYMIILTLCFNLNKFFYIDKGIIIFPTKNKIKQKCQKVIIRIHQLIKNTTWKNSLVEVLKFTINLCLIITYYMVFVSSLSYVEINMDKPYYILGEDVYVILTPSGAIPPIIEKVFYHDIEIYNKSMDPFYERSPRYIIISGSLLKTQPYNSHINVVYKFFDNSTIFFGQFGDNNIKNIVVFYNLTHEYNSSSEKMKLIENTRTNIPQIKITNITETNISKLNLT